MTYTQQEGTENYGMKVAVEGADVKNITSEEDLIYSSAKPGFNVIHKGDVWINFPQNAQDATDVTVELETDFSILYGNLLLLSFADVYSDGSSRLLQFQASLTSNYIGLYSSITGGFLFESVMSINFFGVRVPTAGTGDYPADMSYKISYYVVNV